jgi:hypothetical protein
MSIQTKLRIYDITGKTAVRYVSETWMLNKRDKKQVEAPQMRFLRPLLG